MPSSIAGHLRPFPALLASALALTLPLTLGLTCAQSATMTVPGLGRVVAGNGSKQTLACGSDALSVNGNGNTVTLTGSCTRLTVNGDGNRVAAATVGEIVVKGNGNAVSWQKAVKGSVPVQRVTGNGNKISRR